MHLTSKIALGSLATSLLLGGSAFAEAPSFNAPFHTVIITDRTTSGADFDAAVPSASTNLFRYTDAFDPLDYINLGDVDAATIRFLFSEFDDIADMTPATAGERTLSLNDTTAATAIPGAGDFATAPFLTTSPDGDVGAMDFRNIDLSPGLFVQGTVHDNIGDNTGDDIDAAPQSRVVTMYIKSDDADGIANQSMLVITRKSADPSDVDTLSDPFFADPFDCVFSPADLAGWYPGAIGVLSGVPSNGPYSTAPFLGTGVLDIAGFAFTPARVPNQSPADLSPAGTMALGLTSTAAQVGLANWSLPAADASAPSVTANRIYRLRTSILSSDPATLEEFRVGVGNGGNDVGVLAYHGFLSTDTNAAGLTNTAQDFYTYVVPKGSGSVLTTIDMIDYSNATVAPNGRDEWTLSGLELCAADRAALGSGTQVFNVGAVATAAAGEVLTPAASPSPFVLTGAGANFGAFGHLNMGRPASDASTGTSLVYRLTNFTFNDADPHGDFGQTAWFDAFTANEGSLYLIDVWASASAPANFTGTNFQLRVHAFVGDYNASAVFALDSNVSASGGASTNARAYTLAFEPQINGGGTGSGSCNIVINPFELTLNARNSVDLRIHQVTATEFEL